MLKLLALAKRLVSSWMTVAEAFPPLAPLLPGPAFPPGRAGLVESPPVPPGAPLPPEPALTVAVLLRSVELMLAVAFGAGSPGKAGEPSVGGEPGEPSVPGVPD